METKMVLNYIYYVNNISLVAATDFRKAIEALKYNKHSLTNQPAKYIIFFRNVIYIYLPCRVHNPVTQARKILSLEHVIPGATG